MYSMVIGSTFKPAFRRVEPFSGEPAPAFARSADGRVLPGPASKRAIRLLIEAEKLRAEAVAHLAVADNHEIAAMQGYLSPSRMIAHKTSASKAEADMLARVAAFVGRHAATAQALAEGRLSIAHADRLARVEGKLRDEYTRDEQQLLKACGTRDPEQLGRFLEQWRWKNDEAASKADAGRRFTNRGVTVQERFDGSGTGRCDLDATGLAAFMAALETPPDPTKGPDEPRTLAQRRADRLVGICHETLGATPNPDPEDDDHGACGDDHCAGPKEPVQLSPESVESLLRLITGEDPSLTPVTSAEICAALGLPTLTDIAMGAPARSTMDVMIDLETLLGRNHPDIETIQQMLADGRPLPTEVWEMLACDTSVRRVITKGKSQILNYGRKTEIISSQLRKAIRKRDQHCQFAGCDVPASWCDVHHLIAWHKGGPTDERNLACVCRKHHGMLHKLGWTLHRDKHGRLQTTSP